MFMYYSGKKKYVITVGASISYTCDPSWRSTRDGLIVSAFVASIVAYILAAAAVWVHVFYHKGEELQVVSFEL